MNLFPNVTYIPVFSSNVAVVGYEALDMTHGRIHVGFKSGGVYAYSPMARQEFYDLMTEGVSVGKVVNAWVKRTELPLADKTRLAAEKVQASTPQAVEGVRLHLLEVRNK